MTQGGDVGVHNQSSYFQRMRTNCVVLFVEVRSTILQEDDSRDLKTQRFARW